MTNKDMPDEIYAMSYLEGLEPNIKTKREWWPDGGGDTVKYILPPEPIEGLREAIDMLDGHFGEYTETVLQAAKAYLEITEEKTNETK